MGESLLHLCMLNGTPMFIELAKRLLLHFPKMINDIYLSEDYFGETALHMAIVNEVKPQVKFFYFQRKLTLLLKGCSYGQVLVE